MTADEAMPPPWVECATHMHFDEDCEYCLAEVAVKNEVLQQIGKEILDADRKLTQTTGRSFLRESVVPVALKVDILVQMLFRDPKQRLAYELNYADKLRTVEQETLQAAIRQQILQGGMVMPTARTAGTRHK